MSEVDVSGVDVSEASRKRTDGRSADELRPLSFSRNYTKSADGSCLVQMGDTWVLCTASVESKVPPWLRDSGKGWVTAEYSMLPGSSSERVPREASRGRQGGRTQEIQRLIGRSLRSVCDLALLGERSVIVDCDALQADGGTRVASICGGYVALFDALSGLLEAGELSRHPLLEACAGVSVVILDGCPLLDPSYSEDAAAEVDLNVVMTGSGKLIEVQGTAEGAPFDRSLLDRSLDLASQGIEEILRLQRQTLTEPSSSPPQSSSLSLSEQSSFRFSPQSSPSPTSPPGPPSR